MSRRTVTNAFTGGRQGPRESLAASLAAMQASLRPTSWGFALELSPMQATDAAEALAATDRARSETITVERPHNLVTGTDPGSGEPVPLAALAHRLGLGDGHEIDRRHLVVRDTPLRRLLGFLPEARFDIVRVDGPIEARDARAITQSLERGLSPLEAEVRANASLRIVNNHTVMLQARAQTPLLAFIAQNLRHYLAAMCDRPARDFAAPEPEQLRPFLGAGGLTIRPIETEVFSTFIDVGVCMTAEEPTRPAERSLIYDLPSHTWHAE